MNKIVLSGVSLLAGMGIGGALIGKETNKIICEKQESAEKFRIMYKMMERWMTIKQQGESLEKYFKVNGYQKIAVYGMGDIGRLLVNELNDTDVEIAYGIDKNSSVVLSVPVYHPEQQLSDVDAIVVTAIAYFDEIEEMLSKKIECPILSLEDIVYEMA